VFNNGILTLRHRHVDGNIARQAAPHGHAQGGSMLYIAAAVPGTKAAAGSEHGRVAVLRGRLSH
jgi:hypothetical protein